MLAAPALVVFAGCGDAPRPAVQRAPFAPRKLDAEHLPNAYRIHERVVSGGLPEGDMAFEEIARLGVKTVISVDGMTPDVELAKKHGLRYVHLPHGYDGITDERAKELAKAVAELPGPVYIHCHHGKHRSPAAAAVASIGAGLIEPSDGLAVLRAAGTSENYKGLYDSVRTAQPLSAEELQRLAVTFQEHVPVPPLAEAMVALEHTHAHVTQIAAAGWKSPVKHPDLDPAHEALLLREHFTEMLRMEDVRRRPAAFIQHLKDSEASAGELEEALHSGSVPDAVRRLEAVTRNCTACHREFRDTPLREKSASGATTRGSR